MRAVPIFEEGGQFAGAGVNCGVPGAMPPKVATLSVRGSGGAWGVTSTPAPTPVSVDVPELRAEFLSHYHMRYRRPLKDHLVAGLESMLGMMGRVPRVMNWFLTRSWFKAALARWGGIVDSPLLSEERLALGDSSDRLRRFFEGAPPRRRRFERRQESHHP